jgi:hypothetical protein
VRSVWLVYCAREADLTKLTATLDLESEHAAKSLPTVSVMMAQIQEKGTCGRVQCARSIQETQLGRTQFLYPCRDSSLAAACRGVPGRAVGGRAVQCQWRGRHQLHASRRALGRTISAAPVTQDRREVSALPARTSPAALVESIEIMVRARENPPSTLALLNATTRSPTPLAPCRLWNHA